MSKLSPTFKAMKVNDIKCFGEAILFHSKQRGYEKAHPSVKKDFNKRFKGSVPKAVAEIKRFAKMLKGSRYYYADYVDYGGLDR